MSTSTPPDAQRATPTSPLRQRWSAGRLVGLVLASVGIGLQAVRLADALRSVPDAGAAGVVSVVGSGLSLTVYLLMVGAYLLRTEQAVTDTSGRARVVAVATTFSPFVMPLWPGRDVSTAVDAVASVLLLLGLAGCAWSLRHLWRSFSVVPQARTLVSSGPYRFVRHPLYTTEIVANLGMAVHLGRPFHWVVLALLVAGQVYRARREEQLLLAHVDGYAGYRRRTASLLPGVW